MDPKQLEAVAEGGRRQSVEAEDRPSAREKRESVSGRASRRRKSHSLSPTGSLIVTVTAIEGSANRSGKGRRASIAASLHGAAVENAAVQEVFKPGSGRSAASSKRRRSIAQAN